MRITRAEYDQIIARAAAKAKKADKPAPPLEKEIQADIESWLRSLGVGVAWTRNRMDMATTCKVGQPDFLIKVRELQYGERIIIGFPSAGFYAIEVKRPGQKAKPHQLAELHRWRTAGAIAGVVHSLAEFKSILGAE